MNNKYRSIMMTIQGPEGELAGAQDALADIHTYLSLIDAQFQIEFVSIKLKNNLPVLAYETIHEIAEKYGLHIDSMEDIILVSEKGEKNV